MVLVRFLVFLMGFRIGSNGEVVDNLGTIGFQSLLIAAVALLATVGASYVLRCTMGFDRYGHLVGSVDDFAAVSPVQPGKISAAAAFLNKSNVTMMLSVLAGFAAGYLLILQMELASYDGAYTFTGQLVTLGLYIMVFLVGMDMGFDGSIITVFRESGLKILAFPAVTAVVTVLAVLGCSLFTPLNLKEAAAVACTFCWYSLGPNILMDAGMVMAGAYCFLINFLRVLLSLLTIPLVAAKVGYLETVGMPCTAAMDICIATTTQATNKETAVYAFASGVIFTAVIPVLVPLIVGL